MARILNCTQHKATPEQIADGVIDFTDFNDLQFWLTLDASQALSAGGSKWMATRAAFIILAIEDEIARIGGVDAVMIATAPWFHDVLVDKLKSAGIRYVFAVSDRVSEEKLLPDGSTQKVSVFRHLGFVPHI